MKLTSSSLHKLENYLNRMGLPQNKRERAVALSKIANITKREASQILLFGVVTDTSCLKQISKSLEMEADWLSK